MTSPATRYRARQRGPGNARALPAKLSDGFQQRLDAAEAGLAEPFRGITTDGHVVPHLFPMSKTGIGTDTIWQAAGALLESLPPGERTNATFDLDSEAWRQWSNIHPFMMRHGVLLETLNASQRERVFALMGAGLSPRGFEMARNVMKLNETIREITGRDDEYGEWLYWLSLFGTPSPSDPWGWQIDGHHLNVNCFVLGDQLVLTPMFMGSEPIVADAGRYAGTRVFREEEQGGLRLMRSLSVAQRRTATLGDDLPNEVFTSAFRDNFEMRYEGVRYDELSGDAQRLLLRLIETYVGRIRPGHAEVRMAEVTRHLSETHFAWMGDIGDDSVFYYRIHSPVILIEFDHQRGVALDNDEHSRKHIHTIVRTPNGNDYGKDLLRQHREQSLHGR